MTSMFNTHGDEERAEAAEVARVVGLAVDRDAEQVEGLLVAAPAGGDGSAEMGRVRVGLVEADDQFGQGFGGREVAGAVALLAEGEGLVEEGFEDRPGRLLGKALLPEPLHQGAGLGEPAQGEERAGQRQPVAGIVGLGPQGGDEVRHRRARRHGPARQHAHLEMRARMTRIGLERPLKVASRLLGPAGRPVRRRLGEEALGRRRGVGKPACALCTTFEHARPSCTGHS
ncbi:hypothetical protein [Methylobacterium sp. B4]|uniref:hypothetical protein n=1 Tax=Methylobacterium sp. B4 TaxID=1938755 RepID=UPI0015E8E929|nr:hypothetical protein [Methylobacterium sp. B4]